MPRIGGTKTDPIKFEVLQIRQNCKLVHRYEHCDRSVRIVSIMDLTVPRNCGRPGKFGTGLLTRIDLLTRVWWSAGTVIGVAKTVAKTGNCGEPDGTLRGRPRGLAQRLMFQVVEIGRTTRIKNAVMLAYSLHSSEVVASRHPGAMP